MIKDNFLCKDYLRAIQEIIPHLKWKLHFSNDNKHLNMLNSVGDLWPETDLFNELARKTAKVSNTKIIRGYVNLNPSGEAHAGIFHTDDGEITALFMPMPWNHRMYGGSLDFEDGESIEYKENRLIVFDAKRPHRAMPHTFEGFRYTIAFKMQKNIT